MSGRIPYTLWVTPEEKKNLDYILRYRFRNMTDEQFTSLDEEIKRAALVRTILINCNDYIQFDKHRDPNSCENLNIPNG